MSDWQIFRGDNQSRDELSLPPAPPWRRFDHRSEHRGRTFLASEAEIRMVNAALYLRRPLLVTGPPGSGKSSLAYAVAHELGLGEVLNWPVNSRSTLADGLYRYDAVARLREASLAQSPGSQSDDSSQLDIGDYLTLGPLGTSLVSSDRPRVLLIDEVDKSDIDFPNDLLHVLEDGRFEIPELARIAGKQPTVNVLPFDSQARDDKVVIERGKVTVQEFPFVVITSNGERDLPPAFLRRCLQLETTKPGREELLRIVRAHLETAAGTEVDELIDGFLADRDAGQIVAVDQLLNAVFLITSNRRPGDADWPAIKEILLRSLGEA